MKWIVNSIQIITNLEAEINENLKRETCDFRTWPPPAITEAQDGYTACRFLLKSKYLVNNYVFPGHGFRKLIKTNTYQPSTTEILKVWAKSKITCVEHWYNLPFLSSEKQFIEEQKLLKNFSGNLCPLKIYLDILTTINHKIHRLSYFLKKEWMMNETLTDISMNCEWLNEN